MCVMRGLFNMLTTLPLLLQICILMPEFLTLTGHPLQFLVLSLQLRNSSFQFYNPLALMIALRMVAVLIRSLLQEAHYAL